MNAALRGSRAGWVLLALTVVALALRLKGADQSLFGDELSTWDISRRDSLHEALAIVSGTQEVTPPLFFVLTWLSARLTDDPELGVRLPSLVAGVLLVPLTGFAGIRTVGRPGAVVGAALLALSPFAIWYADEARAYTLTTLLVVAAVPLLLRAIGRGRVLDWALWALLAAAAMLSHYTSLFPLAAMALWAAVAHRERLLPLALSVLGAAALFAPWLPELIDDQNSFGSRGVEIFLPFGADTAWRETTRWLGGVPYEPLASLPGGPAVALLVAALALGAVGALRGASEPDGGAAPPERPVARGLALVVCLAVAAPVGAALASLVSTDVYASRNLLPSLPFALLAAGWLLTRGPRALAWPATLLALIGMGIGAVRGLQDQHRRPGAAGAAAAIGQLGGPRPVVLDLVSLDPRDFGAQLAPYAAAGTRVLRGGRPGAQARALALTRDGRLVVMSYRDPLVPTPRFADRPVLVVREIPGLNPILVTVYGPARR